MALGEHICGGHRRNLARGLRRRSDDMIASLTEGQIMRRFDEVVGSIIGGDFMESNEGDEYISEDGSHIRRSNMASGMKVFAILRILSDNGLLSPGLRGRTGDTLVQKLTSYSVTLIREGGKVTERIHSNFNEVMKLIFEEIPRFLSFFPYGSRLGKTMKPAERSK